MAEVQDARGFRPRASRLRVFQLRLRRATVCALSLRAKGILSIMRICHWEIGLALVGLCLACGTDSTPGATSGATDSDDDDDTSGSAGTTGTGTGTGTTTGSTTTTATTSST